MAIILDGIVSDIRCSDRASACCGIHDAGVVCRSEHKNEADGCFNLLLSDGLRLIEAQDAGGNRNR